MAATRSIIVISSDDTEIVPIPRPKRLPKKGGVVKSQHKQGETRGRPRKAPATVSRAPDDISTDTEEPNNASVGVKATNVKPKGRVGRKPKCLNFATDGSDSVIVSSSTKTKPKKEVGKASKKKNAVDLSALVSSDVASTSKGGVIKSQHKQEKANAVGGRHRKAPATVSRATDDISTDTEAPNIANVKPKGRARKPKCLKCATNGPDCVITISSTKTKPKKRAVKPCKKKNAVDLSVLVSPDVASTSKRLSSSSAADKVGNTTLDCALECECCFCPYDFEYMVQCLEGHLFCCYCLERYAREAVYGQGKVDLVCMTSNCDATFLRSQIEHALPGNLIAKFDDRVQLEAINMAGLTDFYKCKECNTGATMDPEVQYFSCPNEQCPKVFCKLCEVDYKDHRGIACHEIEKDGETEIRKNFEEKMSEAKIRTCHACKSKYTKEPNTCNKITCRCQRTMCYICRAPDIEYNHFCQDVRNPGLPCDKCNKCFLWSRADEDDELAINEIKNLARKARADKGFNEMKAIGAPKDQQQRQGIILVQHQGLEFANRAVFNPAY